MHGHALVTNHIIYNYFQLQDKDSVRLRLITGLLNLNRNIAVEGLSEDRLLEEQLRDILPALAKEHQCAHISPVGLQVLSASGRLNRMIARYCQQEKVSVGVLWLLPSPRDGEDRRGSVSGVPTINRLNYKEKQSGGMFVNTLPL